MEHENEYQSKNIEQLRDRERELVRQSEQAKGQLKMLELDLDK